MDQSIPVQNRRSRRSNVLMAATIEVPGGAFPVKLRNLSQDGALVEGESVPAAGSEVLFRRNELAVAGRVAWFKDGRAGITFAEPLSPEMLMHHIPAPKPRTTTTFKRPGLATRQLSPAERRFGADWVWRANLDKPGE